MSSPRASGLMRRPRDRPSHAIPMSSRPYMHSIYSEVMLKGASGSCRVSAQVSACTRLFTLMKNA